MEKEFVPYELALELKKLGFDEECFACYNMVNKKTIQLKIPMYLSHTSSQEKVTFLNGENSALAPLWQQAFDWFRSEYNIDAWVVPYFLDNTKMYCYIIEGTEYFEDLNNEYDTYEEARLECLKKLIEIVENYE